MKRPSALMPRQQGFTFLELSFVMIVLGMVAALVAQAVPAMRRASGTAATVRNVTNIEFSLLAFAAMNARLPCADTDNDGLENTVPACAVVGKLPYVTLGYAGPLVNSEGYDFKYGLYNAPAVVNTDLRGTPLLSAKMERYRPSVGRSMPQTVTFNAINPSTLQVIVRSRTQTMVVLQEPDDSSLFPDPNPNRRLDFCQGLRAGMDRLFDANYLYVEENGRRKNVAYVLVDPGVGNMDLIGDYFDGLNYSASAQSPRFEHPNRSQSVIYDDRVSVGYFDQFWESLGCSANMATAGRSHPNVETTLALFGQTAVDYRSQLDLAVDIAFAENFGAGAGVADATTALATAASSLSSAIGSALAKGGSHFKSIGYSIGATVNGSLALANAVDSYNKTLDSYHKFQDYRTDFDTLVSTRLNPLYESVKKDVVRSTSLVYSDQ